VVGHPEGNMKELRHQKHPRRRLQVIDPEGYRANVGIVLSNRDGRVFWARRVGRDAWQFPQGGIRHNEEPLDAMYRELREETGLEAGHVELVGATRGWLRYRLPQRMLRRNRKPLCIGQKQIWFVLRLVVGDHQVNLRASAEPEFDSWRWVPYWHPLKEVVFFKRRVYELALREFAPLILGDLSGAQPAGAPHPSRYTQA
jgi:putative (di)nucleoside polyphosphate hydrolase